MINILLNKIIDKKNLTKEEAMILMEEMLDGKLLPSQIAAFLTVLRIKGGTIDEILGFITVMRNHMVKIRASGLVIDTCGTGGDGKGTFNISTTVAFVVAGGGVSVAKHGNRNASSLCGSADVLEALGININLSPQQAENMLVKTGFTFLFAPLFHPAMKNVAQVRKELGIRTVFNILGPFCNPAGVRRQIIGVPDMILAKKLVKVAKRLDYEQLLIVTSDDGMDEISISAKTHCFEVKNGEAKYFVLEPSDFGFKRASMKEIKGGSAKENREIIKKILQGEAGARHDVVLVNSAAAFYIAGKAKTIKEGIKLAEESIDQGLAKRFLEKLISYE